MDISKAKQALEDNIQTTAQFWLITRMTLWGVFFRLLSAFLPLKWVVWFAAPDHPEERLPSEEVMRYLSWLNQTGLLGNTGLCLPRALINQRFLSLANQEPTLFVGFNGKDGHAWVEVDGQALFEMDPAIQGYRPTLLLLPGRRDLIKA